MASFAGFRPSAEFSRHLWVAGVLGNLHDATVALVCVTEQVTRAEFFASQRLLGLGLNSLSVIQHSLQDLPQVLRASLVHMDGQELSLFADAIPPITGADRDWLWEFIEVHLSGLYLQVRWLKQHRPALFNPLAGGGQGSSGGVMVDGV